MANVLFKRGDTATINGTAISDGQLLYNTTTGQHYIDSDSTRKEVGKPVDTALSTTSTNAIANNAITNSIINTTAEVNAITANNIPCGTKPVKELINSLGGLSFGYDSTSGKYGYWKKEADTEVFVPFKSAELKIITFSETNKTIEFEEPPVVVMFFNNSSGAISAFYSPIENTSRGYGADVFKNSDTNYTFNDRSGISSYKTVLYV